MFDTLQNLVSGLGMLGVDPTVNVQYVLHLLDRNSLENMYRGDWLARKIVDAPAEDMTREWRAWQANQTQIEALEEVEKALDLQRKIKQWIVKARLYGGSALVLGVDDGNDPSQAIDLKASGSNCLKYVVVLHRWELNAGPRIYNVADPYYTRPAYYTVATPMFGFEGEPGSTQPTVPGRPPTPPPGALSNFMSNIVPFKGGKPKGGTNYPNTTPTNLGLTQIHPSRIIELPGNDLPDWRLAPMGGGWGDSVLQTVIDSMQDITTTMRAIAAMVHDGKLDVIKMPDMSQRLDQPGYKNKLIERFTLSAQTKSVISALLLDKEEEWNRISTNYAGLPMILHEFITVISGAAGIPVSRLFGQASGRGLSGGSTGGGGAGGDSDLRNYYDTCASIQKNEIAPRLAILDEVLKRTALGKDDPNIHYEWNPLWQSGEDEKAKNALAKAQTTQIYATIGIINEDAFREGVVNQLIEDGTYPGLDDAIEEFGAEPEEPVDPTGGFDPSGAPAPGQPAAFGKPKPKPDMEQQHAGAKGTKKAAKDAKRPFGAKDYSPDQPRGVTTEGTNAGSFAPAEGGGGGGTEGGGGATGGDVPESAKGISEGVAGMARLDQLRKQWAYVDKQLFQYTDQGPKDPVVKKLVSAQIGITTKIHELRLATPAIESAGLPGHVRDVVVVGSGPSGISAGIYGGSEGLNTLIVEGKSEIGGQAAASSRIENVMGFPVGTSGAKLATDGIEQAKRLGAEVQMNKQVTGLSYDEKTGLKTLKFADGSSVQSRAVVIAGGVQFNHVKIPGSDSPDVVYGSSGKLKERVGDGNALIVGGANSAGQAAMDTAISARHVTLVARNGIDNMSDYLVKQISSHPRISVVKDEVTEIRHGTDGRMTGAVLKDGSVLPAQGILYAIGSKPRTDWASGVERNEKGFIKVGGAGRANLETNIPGVYAAGDVREGAIARVITAAADGAAAISMVHGHLDTLKKTKAAA
jgi:uncharacterized protein